VLWQKENNDLFVKDGHISKIEYPLNVNMLDYAANLFNKINTTHLQQNKVYFAVVPDKNRYIADLKLDYDYLESYMNEKLQFATPIKINHLLGAEDYYFTDSHWRQNQIVDVVKELASQMGKSLKDDYTTKTLDKDFYGVYAGQAALNVQPDKIEYLVNDTISQLETEGAKAIYDESKLEEKDAYEFFLSGNQPLVTIKNPLLKDGSRLIIFRDSYASSISPLLAEAYSEIVLIDLRYISSDLLAEYVNFDNANILFLYSATMMNSSLALK
jgi:hypothetical protein